MTTPVSYANQTKQTIIPATSIMTDDREHEVRCGVCAREVYVDADNYRSYASALLSGVDNPFRCEVCAEEYNDLG